jgi:chromate transporter
MLLVAALVARAWLAQPSPDAPSGAPAQAARSAPPPGASAGARAPLSEIAWLNTKAALITFGGAYTALPYFREQMVERHGWLEDHEVLDGLALGETTPGPLICVGTFLSYLAAGLPGAVVGSFFLFLPSFVLVLGLGRYVDRVERLPRARDLLWGFSAGTLGLIVALAATLLPASVPGPFAAAIGLLAFAAVWRLDANLVLVVLAGGALGLLRAYIT